MSDELLIFEVLEEDNSDARRTRGRIRSYSDPFEDLEDDQFLRRYRLTKGLVRQLVEELGHLLNKPTKSTDLSVEIKVLTALSFFATGSYQRPIGDISYHSMAQQSVSQVLAEVTTALNSAEMRNKYICFPQTTEERNRVRTRFYEEFKFPGVLGCIDCTHVAIVRPTEHEERYFCRKHYHSLNVQLICDADMQILSVDSSHGGASHDSFVWNTHPLREYMENLDEVTWFLGDSGYPLRRYMLTPILDARPASPEENYTEMHIRTRNIVERTIGLLKARFRCLLSHRVLHYKPEKAAAIINACVILHNICNGARLPEPTLSIEDELQEAQAQLGLPAAGPAAGPARSGSTRELQQGVATRNSVVDRLWNNRET